MKVCSRCGAPIGRCYHVADPDYATLPQDVYDGTMTVCQCLVGILAGVAVIIGVIGFFAQ